MILYAKRDHYSLLRLTKRFFTTTTTTTKITQHGSTEVHIVGRKKPRKVLSDRLKELRKSSHSENWIKIAQGRYTAIDSPNKVEVATLAHELDKVLFSRGVHYLKDPKTEEYNFTPYLENIIQPANINFDALPAYITSSKDNSLISMARERQKRYIGSTSSISATLSQFYFVMSNFKPVNISGLSSVFKDMSNKFTRGTKMAASIYLRWKDGVYAIDADKSLDKDETILSVMGKSLEKVLTTEPEEFERYLKENEDSDILEERNKPESYAYGEFRKFLLRSQLDCYHPRLKRKTFDLKTRAAIPVRLDVSNYRKYLGYSLKKHQGLYESYEREYYDMLRSAFLKYIFQVRIGHMDGVLVAYHNTKKIFGFQYISRKEMDKRLFGSSRIGDLVFHRSLAMLEALLDKATEKYPEQTLRLSFETSPGEKNAMMNIFVEAVPSSEHGAEKYEMEPYEDLTVYRLQTSSFINGLPVHGPLSFQNPHEDNWNMRYRLNEVYEDDPGKKMEQFKLMRRRQATVMRPEEDSSKPSPLLEKLYKISQDTLNEDKLKETDM
ncbi:hypothetical protein G6F57_002929 [Rhizopus arrhizus]|nr:hypothetical protein G6F30_004090 [Rhizopus arrhizus]KAG1423709.1 hypothetical protein G6F58_002711 [Rhizopus delemar]KAG0989098.1 hypothetical protein G6F29_001256 [Rhizopus arrhizus]KAG0999841.1 hypothetical protein G6F28_000637 [Rhizopus arrhizus]KAG1014249.1 hypothetical protein G6F27_001141 [Rhizopus arrhizus]